jgi:hypothetical protein
MRCSHPIAVLAVLAGVAFTPAARADEADDAWGSAPLPPAAQSAASARVPGLFFVVVGGVPAVIGAGMTVAGYLQWQFARPAFGCTGLFGNASDTHASECEAGVRDDERAGNRKMLTGVEVAGAGMGIAAFGALLLAAAGKAPPARKPEKPTSATPALAPMLGKARGLSVDWRF